MLELRRYRNVNFAPDCGSVIMSVTDRRGFKRVRSSRAPKERGEVFDPLHIVMLGLCRELAEERKDGRLFSGGGASIFARAP
jgi:hypothetical protein